MSIEGMVQSKEDLVNVNEVRQAVKEISEVEVEQLSVACEHALPTESISVYRRTRSK